MKYRTAHVWEASNNKIKQKKNLGVHQVFQYKFLKPRDCNRGFEINVKILVLAFILKTGNDANSRD